MRVDGHVVPRRSTAPSVKPTLRGELGLALDAAATLEGRKRAREEFDRDVHAATTLAPRCSLLRTWTRLHHAWYGDFVPIVPLTCEKITNVAAMFKQGRYRSFGN